MPSRHKNASLEFLFQNRLRPTFNPLKVALSTYKYLLQTRLPKNIESRFLFRDPTTRFRFILQPIKVNENIFTDTSLQIYKQQKLQRDMCLCLHSISCHL